MKNYKFSAELDIYNIPANNTPEPLQYRYLKDKGYFNLKPLCTRYDVSSITEENNELFVTIFIEGTISSDSIIETYSDAKDCLFDKISDQLSEFMDKEAWIDIDILDFNVA